MWCCSIGTPATGNNGLGTSKESGLNRVPAQYKQLRVLLTFPKVFVQIKRHTSEFESSLNCERQHDGKIDFLMRKKKAPDIWHRAHRRRFHTRMRAFRWLKTHFMTQTMHCLGCCLQPFVFNLIQFNLYLCGGSSRERSNKQIDWKCRYSSGQNLYGFSNSNKGKQVVLASMPVLKFIEKTKKKKKSISELLSGNSTQATNCPVKRLVLFTLFF